MTLPLIKATVRVYNKDFEIINGEHYHFDILDAEVLTLNLNSGTMRIRSPARQFSTCDIPITEFFEQYSIVKLNKEQ